MLNLIRKDLLSLRFYIAAGLLYVVIFGTFAFTPTMTGAFPAILIPLYATHIELRYKSMLFVGSLPVRRSQVVMAKYGSAFIYLVLGFLLTLVLQAVHRYGLDRSFPITTFDLAVAAALVMLFTSLYYPIQYALGSRNSTTVSFVLIFLTIAASGWIGNVANQLSLEPSTEIRLIVGLPLAGVALMCVSYRISIAIFLRKDLEA
ncbi:ABC-2 transporter permease [Cohnella hongkongensis]|uniref:ABC-2 transporter permease n=1 Tax=Cohnella hongkongensis TaxID=178337 RepID=A0ABV9F4P7_9BACL